MTPDELHALAAARLRKVKAESLRVAGERRRAQAEAQAAGEAGIARQLGMLAVHAEQAAALAEAELRDRAARHARALRATANRDLARRARPGRRTPLHDALREHLGPLKRSGVAFKDLMRRWERERIGPLRLHDLGGDRYAVEDEDGDAPRAEYSLGTLRRLYSETDR